ncbi:MAG: IMP cyclohydrolase [Planctomycetota bacterium]|jgi:phosphoribosylaminoimidazolecarboxamide formyltransferase/IMP cyclohydrolase|nr:IMP cyclohydrolase [Planctomycetota bacterium]
MEIRRALISVSDKTGVVEFAGGLAELGIEILSTGGTAGQLRESGLAVRDVSDYTGFPEIMNGRVKTLHPKIYGGILGLRSTPEHMQAMEDHEIGPIDLVAVNLYPFEETVAKVDCTLEDAIENIDIGGPCMVRASAKNHHDVIIIVRPERYSEILSSLRETGNVDQAKRRQLAIEAYTMTSGYDAAIVEYLSSAGITEA